MALRSFVAACLVLFFALSSANVTTLREELRQHAEQEGINAAPKAAIAAPKATTCSDRDITIGGMSCLQAKVSGYCGRNTNLGNIGRDLCPKSCGKCPTTSRATSAAPKTITAAPKATTAAQKTTAAPKATTAVPKETTAALKVATAAPKTTTPTPKETTAAPRRTTAAPKSTAAPKTSTATPQRTTATKKKNIVAPKVTTASPKTTTGAAIINTAASKKWKMPWASEKITAPKATTAAPKTTTTAMISIAAPKKSVATFKVDLTTPKPTTLAPKGTIAARRLTTAAPKRTTAAPARTTAVLTRTTAELQASAPGTDDGNAHERNSDTNSAVVQEGQQKKAAKSDAVSDVYGRYKGATAGTPMLQQKLSAVKGAAADAVASAGSAAASAGSAITAFLGGGPVTTLPPGPPGPSTSTVYMSFEQRLEAQVKDADGPVGPLQTLSVSKAGLTWTRQQGVPGMVVNTLRTWVASREMPNSEREPILFFGGLSVVTLFCFFPMCRCPGLVRRIALELNTFANHGNREDLG